MMQLDCNRTTRSGQVNPGIGLGAVVAVYPAAGALNMVWIIAATSVIVGAALIHFGMDPCRVARSVG